MSATILVVEDDAAISVGLEELLIDEGYRVLTAANGRVAMTIATGDRPDLIILDNNLPVLDGPGTLRELRADHALAAVPVILVSASGSRAAAGATAAALGVFAVLTKPYDLERLLREVARALHA